MILIRLFLSFFKIGLFSFGGGLAMLPLIQQETVQRLSWLTQQEFLDAIAIAQVTPGPIALNVATYSGYRVAGMAGSLFATIGVSMPSFLICLTLAILFQRVRGHDAYQNVLEIIKLVAVALILSTAVLLWPDSIGDVPDLMVFGMAFWLFNLQRINPALIIVLAGLGGLLMQ